MQKTSMLMGQLSPMSFPEWVLLEIERAPWNVCVTPGNEHLAYSDLGMPIGNGRITLKPIEMAYVLSELAPKDSDLVLEVGSSAMRLTSILSKICCGVYNVEVDPMCYKADSELSQALALRNVSCILGDIDALEEQQYDLIMVNTPIREVNDELLALLTDGGRLCAIVGDNTLQKILLYKNVQGKYESKEVIEISMPMDFKDRFIL